MIANLRLRIVSFSRLDTNDLKYCPSNAGVMAFPTLRAYVPAANAEHTRALARDLYTIPVPRPWYSTRGQTFLEVHPPCSLLR